MSFIDSGSERVLIVYTAVCYVVQVKVLLRLTIFRATCIAKKSELLKVEPTIFARNTPRATEFLLFVFNLQEKLNHFLLSATILQVAQQKYV